MKEDRISLEYNNSDNILKFNISESFHPTTDIFDDMAEFFST